MRIPVWDSRVFSCRRIYFGPDKSGWRCLMVHMEVIHFFQISHLFTPLYPKKPPVTAEVVTTWRWCHQLFFGGSPPGWVFPVFNRQAQNINKSLLALGDARNPQKKRWEFSGGKPRSQQWSAVHGWGVDVIFVCIKRVFLRILLYHAKSPSNYHLGEDFFYISTTLSKSMGCCFKMRGLLPWPFTFARLEMWSPESTAWMGVVIVRISTPVTPQKDKETRVIWEKKQILPSKIRSPFSGSCWRFLGILGNWILNTHLKKLTWNRQNGGMEECVFSFPFYLKEIK